MWALGNVVFGSFFFQVVLVWACEAGLALYIVWTGAGVWASGCWGCFLQVQRLVELLSKVCGLFIFSKSWSPNEVRNLPLARYPFLFLCIVSSTKRCFCFIAIALPYKNCFELLFSQHDVYVSFSFLGAKEQHWAVGPKNIWFTSSQLWYNDRPTTYHAIFATYLLRLSL